MASTLLTFKNETFRDALPEMAERSPNVRQKVLFVGTKRQAQEESSKGSPLRN
jgi:ribosomal protein S2